MNGKSMIFHMFLLVIGLVFGCKEKKTSVQPDGLLNSEVMVAILKDVYVTEARVSSLSVTYDSSQQIFNLVENDILERHGTNDSVYLLSMQYYFEHPDELRLIFEAVVDSLSLQERKLSRPDNSLPPEN
ncbi:DUF4296 domain-containing protein [Fulvivirga sedimenti]|uniref:DUF4296 domain-containing protein n=1 Tax=Fulvivirga sedimenti TaxID=2879465 RepID=A0A9X1KVN8_9BACT|nr:DUF4296 domain-containing protein [Fulvivirga sedimenti]MCA6073880.1 DUF4296 domain-containing protein [Fulvivirga sedimenti]